MFNVRRLAAHCKPKPFERICRLVACYWVRLEISSNGAYCLDGSIDRYKCRVPKSKTFRKIQTTKKVKNRRSKKSAERTQVHAFLRGHFSLSLLYCQKYKMRLGRFAAVSAAECTYTHKVYTRKSNGLRELRFRRS